MYLFSTPSNTISILEHFFMEDGFIHPMEEGPHQYHLQQQGNQLNNDHHANITWTQPFRTIDYLSIYTTNNTTLQDPSWV